MVADADEDGPVVQAAAIAGAIAEPARARMLAALLDGRHRTATELALVARVAPSTASTHLARLCTSGLVSRVAQGRHRYFRLAAPEAAAALEALFGLAGAGRGARTPGTPPRLRFARTCYDHLAGELGVALHDRLLASGWLVAKRKTYTLAAPGEAGLAAWGVDVAAARAARRRFAAPCLDWSERKPHLAGALAAAILSAWQGGGWLARELDGREVSLTARGRRALAPFLGAALTSAVR